MRRLLLTWRRFALVSLLLLSLVPNSSNAQTDYSLRIRALGVDFAGMIDDELTDVYLNPARTGVIKKRTLHAANLVNRYRRIPFPTSENFYSSYDPEISFNESILHDYSYVPLVIAYLGPLWGGIKASLSFEAYLAGSDNFDSSFDTYFSDSYGGYFRNRSTDRNNSSDAKHLLFDATVASPQGSGYLGVSVRAEHDEKLSNYFYSEDVLRTLVSTPNEAQEDYNYQNSMYKFEKTGVKIAFGSYRPESGFRDLVIGFNGARYLFPAQTSAMRFLDSDVDGNGTGFPSGTWNLRTSRSYYDSNREYRALGTSARVHLRLGEKWRTVHTIGLTKGEGDGGAAFESQKQDQDPYRYNYMSGHLEYGYDGSMTDFFATTGVGLSEEIYKHMIFSWAVKAFYSRKEFEETGEGEINIKVFGDDYPDSLDQNNEYNKEYNAIEESYRAAFLFAFEWEIKNFIVLRLGGYLGATHFKSDYEYDQNVILQESLNAFYSVPGDVIDYNIAYNTSVQLTNGIEIKIKDKLKLDLYMNYSSMHFADYDHIELRYCF